jgi:hypothetical protein
LDPALELVLRSALALLLGASALEKARDLATFRAAIEGYDLLPARAAGSAAPLFPVLEAALAVALLAPLGLGVRGAALGGAGLLFAFYAAAIAVNLARGRREIDCGCGGPAAHLPLSGWLVARNAGLVAVALACRTGTTARPLGGVDALTVAGGLAVLALVWIALHGLLAQQAAIAHFQEDV